MTLIGYFLGQIPGVKEHIEVVIVVVVFLSILPGIIASRGRGSKRESRGPDPEAVYATAETRRLTCQGGTIRSRISPTQLGDLDSVDAVVLGHHPRPSESPTPPMPSC